MIEKDNPNNSSLRDKHLGKNEQIIIDRFKYKFPQFSINLRYDFKLIPQLSLIDQERNNILKNWNSSNCPRIDAVASLPGDIPVIYEIRPQADWTAISAVIAYKELFRTIFNYTFEIRMGIICESMSQPNKTIAKLFSIEIFEV